MNILYIIILINKTHYMFTNKKNEISEVII
nr:MAG TPA: hypothetical protein [Caudoviricetes sp.]